MWPKVMAFAKTASVGDDWRSIGGEFQRLHVLKPIDSPQCLRQIGKLAAEHDLLVERMAIKRGWQPSAMQREAETP